MLKVAGIPPKYQADLDSGNMPSFGRGMLKSVFKKAVVSASSVVSGGLVGCNKCEVKGLEKQPWFFHCDQCCYDLCQFCAASVLAESEMTIAAAASTTAAGGADVNPSPGEAASSDSKAASSCDPPDLPPKLARMPSSKAEVAGPDLPKDVLPVTPSGLTVEHVQSFYTSAICKGHKKAVMHFSPCEWAFVRRSSCESCIVSVHLALSMSVFVCVYVCVCLCAYRCVS